MDGRGLHSTEHHPCILKVLPRFPDRMGIWSKLDMIKQKKKKKKKKGEKTSKTINITRVRCQDDVDGRGLHSTEHHPCILKVLPRFPDRMGIWSKLDMIKQKKKKKKKKRGKKHQNCWACLPP